MTDAETFTGEFFVPGTDPRIELDHRARYEWAAPLVPGKHVLDIACGSGYGAMMLATAGALSVTGVDISDDALTYAKAAFGGQPSIEFVSGDICTFAGRPGGYDVITCFETIEHVPDHVSAVCNLARLLTPGGTLLMSSPNRPITSPGAAHLDDKPRNPFHVREFVPDELREQIASTGLTLSPTLFGQRLQPMKLPKILQLVYGRVVMPRTSSDVRPVTRGVPRYFCVSAHRPPLSQSGSMVIP